MSFGTPIEKILKFIADNEEKSYNDLAVEVRRIHGYGALNQLLLDLTFNGGGEAGSDLSRRIERIRDELRLDEDDDEDDDDQPAADTIEAAPPAFDGYKLAAPFEAAAPQIVAPVAPKPATYQPSLVPDISRAGQVSLF